MRLVLFIDYEGDGYTYSGPTIVLPITHESKDSAEFEFHNLIETNQKEYEYKCIQEEIWLKKWRNNEVDSDDPNKPVFGSDYIVFSGHEIQVARLILSQTKVLTLDEWFGESPKA